MAEVTNTFDQLGRTIDECQGGLSFAAQQTTQEENVQKMTKEEEWEKLLQRVTAHLQATIEYNKKTMEDYDEFGAYERTVETMSKEGS